MAIDASAITEDRVLGGRVRLCQPRQGYRAAIDPVLLAAAVRARPGETVLDLGCGVGTAALCLAARLDGVRIIAIDSDPEAVELAAHNVRINAMEDRIAVVHGAVPDRLPEPPAGGFDHVMTNPPYLPPGRGRASAQPSKARANTESVALTHWLACCAGLLRHKGSLTVIQRADRLDALLAGLAGHAGEVSLFPLWPHAGRPAGRVLVRARRGLASPLVLQPGLVLHDAAGGYSAATDAVLRDAAALDVGPGDARAGR